LSTTSLHANWYWWALISTFATKPTVQAECAAIVWYDDDANENAAVAVEFSYRYGNPEESYSGAAARCAFDVFGVLQTKLTKWGNPTSGTKTAFVCR
jgi:hypothetical protein